MDEAWLRALVAFPFGLALGSFMTVVVARVPETRGAAAALVGKRAADVVGYSSLGPPWIWQSSV